MLLRMNSATNNFSLLFHLIAEFNQQRLLVANEGEGADDRSTPQTTSMESDKRAIG
jgi:hypothetical protein